MDDLDIIEIFENILRTHRLSKNSEEKPTHTSLTGGSYCFEGKDYEEFLNAYKNVVPVAPKEDYHLALVERQRKVGPIICDLDIKVKEKHGVDKERLYNDNHVEQIVTIVMKCAYELFKVEKDDLQAFVFGRGEAPSKEQSGDFKDGFHVYFPYLPLRVEYRMLLYQACINKIKKFKVLDDIPLLETVEKVYDPSVVYANGILMIGSCKKGRNSYILTHKYCYNDKNHTVYKDEIDTLKDDIKQLIELTSLRMYDDDASLELRNKKLIKDAVKIARDKKYPTELVPDTDDETELDTSTEVSTVDNYRVKPGKISETPDEQKCICCHKRIGTPPEDDAIVRRIVLECLNRKRRRDYDTWLRVGWALHRIWHGYLDLFIEWSFLDTKKYQPGCCERVWMTAKDNSYCLPSLVKWGRQDDPKLYNEIIEEKITDIIKRTSITTHDDLATIIYTKYKHIYVCIDIQKNIWYEYKGHRWEQIQDGYTLNERISSEICPLITKIQDNFFQEKRKLEDKEATDNLRELHMSIRKIYEKLKDVTYKNNLMKACKNKFYDSKFLEKLNSNPKLIGFENGVFDLQMVKCDDAGNVTSVGAFRDGTPDDYITFSTKYEWKEYNPDDKVIKEINDYFEKVQTNSEVRRYLLRLIATYIDGSIRNQQFIFWPGSGGNGKSSTIDLIKHSFGEYTAPMPVKVLTGATPDATAATPALSDKAGKRFVPVSEPAHNEVLNISTMKILTGGDEICARPLYGPMFYYTPQFKMILACNNLPTIPSLDGGTWRRIVVLSFDSRFIDQED